MQCTLTGPGVHNGITRGPHRFEINCEDAEVNSVVVTGPDGSERITRLDSQNRNGQWDSLESGLYTISVTFSKTIKVDKARTKAYGPATTSGDARNDIYFVIDSGMKTGGHSDQIHIEVEDPNGEVLELGELTDHGDGSYEGAAFHPYVKGKYRISVRVFGEHVSGSPFTPTFEAAIPSQTVATGVGVEGGPRAKKGRILRFEIQSRDSAGDDLMEGGEPFKVIMKTPSSSYELELDDHTDGRYGGQYFADEEGPYQIDITLHKKHISGSPFNIIVNPQDKDSKKIIKKVIVDTKRTKMIPVLGAPPTKEETESSESESSESSESSSSESPKRRKVSKSRSRSKEHKKRHRHSPKRHSPQRRKSRSRSDSRDRRRRRPSRSPPKKSSAPSSQLWVGGLPHDFVERDVRELFDPFGKIVDIDLRRGWCFLRFSHELESTRAVRELNGKDLKDRKMQVEFRMEKGAPKHGKSGEKGRDRDRDRGDRSRDLPPLSKRMAEVRHVQNGVPKNWRVEVSGLSSNTGWQDLKDWARECGVEVAYTVTNGDGTGVVDVGTKEEFEKALERLPKTPCVNRDVKVHAAKWQPDSDQNERDGKDDDRGDKEDRPEEGDREDNDDNKNDEKKDVDYEKERSQSRKRGRSPDEKRNRGRDNGPNLGSLRHGGKPPPSGYTCHLCYKPGHWKEDCKLSAKSRGSSRDAGRRNRRSNSKDRRSRDRRRRRSSSRSRRSHS